MKRSLITTFVIGAVVAIFVGVLHATKAIAGFETGVARLVTDYARATRVVGEKWQYVFVLLIALGVAWLSLSKVPRWHVWLLIGLLLVELFGLAWVCSLYRVFFQPAPSVLALVFVVLAAEWWSAFLDFLGPNRNTHKRQRALFSTWSKILANGAKIRRTWLPAATYGQESAPARSLPVHYKRVADRCSWQAANRSTWRADSAR